MFREIILAFLLILAQGAIFDSQLGLTDPLLFPDPFQQDSLSQMHSPTSRDHEGFSQNSQEKHEKLNGCEDSEDKLRDITNEPERFQKCLDSIVEEFPDFEPFDVLQAHQSTLNSMEKHLRLKKRDETGPEMLFKVIEQENTPPKVLLEQYLHANGYSREEVEQALSELSETIPALKDHKLVEAWSSSKVSNGKKTGQLTLKLKKDDDELIVYLSTYKGKSWIAIYGL